jgi:hypothetical protein
MNPQALNSYSYANNNPVISSDPDGKVLPLIVIAAVAWAVVEIGLSAYDIYSTTETVLDKNAPIDEKITSVGFTIAGVFLPGGGYGKIGKEGLKVAKTSKLFSTIKLERERIWQLAKNTGEPEVERIAQRLFKTTDTVAGGTAGAYKYEKQTGKLLSPSGHEQAAKDVIGWIEKTLPKVNKAGQNLLNSFKKGLERVLNKQY